MPKIRIGPGGRRTVIRTDDEGREYHIRPDRKKVRVLDGRKPDGIPGPGGIVRRKAIDRLVDEAVLGRERAAQYSDKMNGY